jgi:hypothetical protein
MREMDQIVAATASPLYVGRTALPERRLLEQVREGRRHLTILHWANDISERANVQETREPMDIGWILNLPMPHSHLTD